MKTVIVAAIAYAALGAAQVSVPRIGIAADGDGVLRTVAGVAGNLISGEPITAGVVSAAASDSAVVVTTASDIRVLDTAGREQSRTSVPAGPALFAFSAAGAPEFVWLSSTGKLMRWSGSAFVPVSMPSRAISGAVLAVGSADSRHIRIAARWGGGVEILQLRIRDGAVAGVTPLPDGSGAVLLMADGAVLYAADGCLIERDNRGHERRIAFQHVVSSMAPISACWVMVNTAEANRRFAVRLADGAAFQIPEVR